MQPNELIRPWTESLTTMWIGSLSLLFPAVTKIDPDGSLSFHFGEIPNFLKIVEGNGAFGSIVLGFLFLGFVMAIGAVLIQFGEFLAVLPDLKRGRVTHKKRIEKAGSNPAYATIFSNAFLAFRLLSGVGTFMLLSGLVLLIVGISAFSIQTAGFGLLILFFGLNLIFVFARYSFTYLDWLAVGELTP